MSRAGYFPYWTREVERSDKDSFAPDLPLLG